MKVLQNFSNMPFVFMYVFCLTCSHSKKNDSSREIRVQAGYSSLMLLFIGQARCLKCVLMVEASIFTFIRYSRTGILCLQGNTLLRKDILTSEKKTVAFHILKPKKQSFCYV